MSKTIRHNREGKQYKDKDSAGVCYHTSVLDSRKRVVPKKMKMHYIPNMEYMLLVIC